MLKESTKGQAGNLEQSSSACWYLLSQGHISFQIATCSRQSSAIWIILGIFSSVISSSVILVGGKRLGQADARQCPQFQTSSEAEKVLPVGTFTRSMWLGTDQTDRQSVPMNTDKTSDLVLLSSLAEQDGGLQVRIYIYVYVYVSTHRCPHAHRKG